MKDTTP